MELRRRLAQAQRAAEAGSLLCLYFVAAAVRVFASAGRAVATAARLYCFTLHHHAMQEFLQACDIFDAHVARGTMPGTPAYMHITAHALCYMRYTVFPQAVKYRHRLCALCGGAARAMPEICSAAALCARC